MINGSKAYRYLRYYTPSGFANVGELEFYEKIVDRTLLSSCWNKRMQWSRANTPQTAMGCSKGR